MEPVQRTCLECGKTLKGRIDKKFCDDYCRNAHNNKQNSDHNHYVRNVNNTLRKNRRILESLLARSTGTATCSKTRLVEQGFSFNFHTNQLTTQKGDTYFFCYEYGYRQLDEAKLLIVKRKEE